MRSASHPRAVRQAAGEQPRDRPGEGRRRRRAGRPVCSLSPELGLHEGHEEVQRIAVEEQDAEVQAQQYGRQGGSRADARPSLRGTPLRASTPRFRKRNALACLRTRCAPATRNALRLRSVRNRTSPKRRADPGSPGSISRRSGCCRTARPRTGVSRRTRSRARIDFVAIGVLVDRHLRAELHLRGALVAVVGLQREIARGQGEVFEIAALAVNSGDNGSSCPSWKSPCPRSKSMPVTSVISVSSHPSRAGEPPSAGTHSSRAPRP